MWTDEDRDKAIWHAKYKAERCSGCGTHPDEWNPNKGGDRQAYGAVEERCAGCAALEQHQEALSSRAKEDRVRGVRVVLRPRAEIERRVAAERAKSANPVERRLA